MARIIPKMLCDILIVLMIALAIDSITVYGWLFIGRVGSNSMEPTLPVGDYIIVRSYEDYAVDDIIAFRTISEKNKVHRIIGNSPEGFITRGDNLDEPDGDRVRSSDVIGKVVLVLSKEEFMKYVMMYIGIFGVILTINIGLAVYSKVKNVQSDLDFE